MKKIYLLLLIACGLLGANPARAQLSGSDSLQLKLAAIFANVDKSQVPTGYLYEAGAHLLDMRSYSGVLADSNLTDMDVLRYLRLVTHSALVYGQDTLPTVKTYNARLDAAATGNVIPISVQYLPYASIKPRALQDNLLTVQNEQVYDVAGRSQSPYQTQVLFAAAPVISRARTNTVSFLFRRNLYLTGDGSAPSSIYLDFGDGNGYQSATWNQSITTTYSDSGTKRVKVKFIYYHSGFGSPPIKEGQKPAPGLGYYETVESWFNFDVWSVAAALRTTGTTNCAICDGELPIGASYTSGAEHSGGTVYTVFGNGPGGVKHTQWTKPFIISEGYNLFDIADELRKCNNPNNDITALFENIDKDFASPSTGNFRTSLLNAGYDIVYIDNARGTDDIVRNAHLFEAVIRLVNQNKVGGKATGEKNVVMGQSMGGLVSRYGLAEMAKRSNDDPHTRLLVLQDSPQRGANNPVGVQSLTRSFDVPFLFGNSLADMLSQIRATVRVLDQPATQQLSLLNAYNGRSDIRANTFIASIYQPMITFSGSAPYDVVAVSNGSQCGNAQNTPVGVQIAQSSLAILLPGALFSASPIGPGAHGVTGEFASYGLPAYGQRATVSRVDLRLEYQIRIGYCPFCVTIPIRFHLLQESAQSPANTLPYETLPGGTANPVQQAGGCASGFDFGSLNGVYAAYFRTNLYNGNICFVPSFSALDVPTVTASTAFAKYINNITNNPSAPNVARYVAQETSSMPHLTFTPRNSEWIFNEMQRPAGSTALNAPACSTECDLSQQATLSGPTSICPGSTGTYAVNNLPAGYTVTWQANGGATPATGMGSTFAVTAPVGSSTNVQVVATIGNACTSRSLSTNAAVTGGDLVITNDPAYSRVASTTKDGSAARDATQPNSPNYTCSETIYLLANGFNVPPPYTGTITTYRNTGASTRTFYTSTAAFQVTVNDFNISIVLTGAGSCNGSSVTSNVYQVAGCAGRVAKQQPASYPNPADAVLNLAAPETTEVGVSRTAVLYNAQGREVSRTHTPAESKLATANLSTGLYYLVVEQNGHITRSQVRVQH
ncbi:hypothetical protein ACVWYF_001169 [Hymenobacter sp. UYAg731]